MGASLTGVRLPRLPERPRERRVPGEVGTWVFILGDMTAFAFVFAVFLAARAGDPVAFAAGARRLDATFGVLNTLLLLTSSVCVVGAVRAAARREPGRARLRFGAAAVLGAGFVFDKYLEYSDKIAHGLTPARDDFWTYYYVLTGLHLFHVLVGLGVLAFAAREAGKPRLTARRFAYIEGAGCFWHMVDALWIVLFPLLYLLK